MDASFSIWKMLAGVAFFLLAMNFMEASLKHLANRKFKLFIKYQTHNKLKAIGGGAIATGLLQSSSIVNLLVLSMVGAGVVQMENALAIILGSNLGSTFSSWIVALFGFDYNIENLMLPIAGVAGILMAFINTESKKYLWLKFMFSLAFLFIAFGFIKTGMEGFVKQTDLSVFTQYPVIVFLLLGVLLTAIVQSSSATMALALSALYTNAISLYVATAIILGSEIGTTLKLFFVPANGIAAKKRVALGNFLFNCITVFFIFILLWPINNLITNVLKITNKLFALVFFQTFINFCSIILFTPFLKVISRFLLKRFVNKQDESVFISQLPVTDATLALEALEKEVSHFILHVIEYSLNSFSINESINTHLPNHKNFSKKTVTEKYNYIKQLHGEMHGFCLKLQHNTTDKTESERIEQLISSIRNGMYAAKNIRDAQSDIAQMINSSNDVKYNFYQQATSRIIRFYQYIFTLLNKQKATTNLNDLSLAYNEVIQGYSKTLQSLYKEPLIHKINEIEISTLINFNREIYTSYKSILFSLKDYLLTHKEAEYFDGLPGFIR